MIKRSKRHRAGFTLVEAVVSVLVFGTTIGATLGAFMISRISVNKAKHYIQVMNLLRQKMEEETGKDYDAVVSASAASISIDIGPDLVRDTSDDLLGTILVEVRDKYDIDNDSDTTEAEIDIDGDYTGDYTNDPCKPIYISISWTDITLGGDSNLSEELATLVIPQ